MREFPFKRAHIRLIQCISPVTTFSLELSLHPMRHRTGHLSICLVVCKQYGKTGFICTLSILICKSFRFISMNQPTKTVNCQCNQMHDFHMEMLRNRCFCGHAFSYIVRIMWYYHNRYVCILSGKIFMREKNFLNFLLISLYPFQIDLGAPFWFSRFEIQTFSFFLCRHDFFFRYENMRLWFKAHFSMESIVRLLLL